MKRLPSLEDEMNGVVTYQLSNGRYVRLEARAVREHGVGEVLRHMGYGDLLPTARMRVHERGATRTTRGPCIGTVPLDFDPLFIKSRSPMYDPRPTDFVRDGEVWIVSPALGPGDLAAVIGFIPSAEGSL